MKVLSLGAGVQSSTIVHLIIDGTLPKPDVAIFADTKWEPQAVYEHLKRLESYAADNDFKITRVSAGDLRRDALTPDHSFASMPLYTKDAMNSVGMLRRQCTREYKLAPILIEIRKHGATAKNPTEMWIGISTDEAMRMKDSRVKYAVNKWPLIDLGWGRDSCREYLKRIGWDVPKSSCIGCPFHDNHYWKRMKQNEPEEWADAVEFDEAIRNNVGREPVYLHRNAIPLERVYLGEDQLDLFQIAECEGMCGV